jgi:long-chain acyl-CoA synthetase
VPTAQQVVIIGNGRGYLTALLTGTVSREEVQAALDAVNHELPHYKQVRAFHLRTEPFSIDNGMLTANGKLKRDLISALMKSEIDDMYRTVKTA